jgi:hypothetical protein
MTCESGTIGQIVPLSHSHPPLLPAPFVAVRILKPLSTLTHKTKKMIQMAPIICYGMGAIAIVFLCSCGTGCGKVELLQG